MLSDGQKQASANTSRVWLWAVVFSLGVAVGVGATFFLLTEYPDRASNVPNSSAARMTAQRSAAPKTAPVGAVPVRDVPVPAAPGASQPKGRLKIDDALLLNGGGSAQSNYFSHHLHIRMFEELMRRRGLSRGRISVFSTDGQSPKPDQLVSEGLGMKWLFASLPEEQLLNQAQLINTTLQGYKMQPARKADLGRWFRQYRKTLSRRKRASTLMLFVTDHGTRGKGPLGNKIELWNQQINVGELRNMLRPLPPKTRVVTVMSQCYSGGFANLLYKGPNRVHGRRCGFFSTLASREAYGCFPETASADRVGHAYRMGRAMRTAATFADAHRVTLLTDTTPDVPLATSDVYLEDELRRVARRKGRSMIRFVDGLLKQARKKKPRYLRDEWTLLRRMQKRFGLPQHRSLQAVWSDIRTSRKRQSVIDRIDNWKKVLGEVRQRALIRFYQDNPKLASLVEREMQRPDIDDSTRALGRRLYKSYLKFLKKKPHIKQRVQQLYQRDDLIQKRVYQLHVREGILLRMNVLLTRIAGLYYMRKSGSKQQRRDLRALLRCEATSLGEKVVGHLAAEGKPQPQKAKRKMLARKTLRKTSDRQLLPSWLGIVFQPARANWHPRFSRLAPGASSVVEVGPNTPASEAGLKKGDIIASFNGKMLKLSNEIRDRVMLSSPRKKAYMMVYRNGKFRTLSVQLRRLQFSGNELAQLKVDPNFDPNSEPDTQVHGLQHRPYRSLAPPKKRQPLAPLTTLDGKPVSLTSPKGPTMLFFWATWCEGCKQLVPLLRKFRARYRAKGLRILAVTTDNAATVRPFLQQWGSRFPFEVALDPQGKISRRYRIAAIPQLIILGSQGKQILHLRRMPGNLESLLHSKIRSGLK